MCIYLEKENIHYIIEISQFSIIEYYAKYKSIYASIDNSYLFMYLKHWKMLTINYSFNSI